MALNYTRAPHRFTSAGMDLNHPVDLMPPGKLPFLKNVRSYQDGRLETRPGSATINSSPLGDLILNTDFRMNDYVVASFLRFIGAGSHLYGGTGSSYSVIGSGYSGNPLSIVPYLPQRSVDVWGYVADQNKLAKYDVSGNERPMGIAPPKIIPGMELIQPNYTTPTGNDATSPFNQAGSWGNSGSTTTPALNPGGMPGRLVGVQIGTISYLSGTTGWALIAPTGGNPSMIVAGMRMLIGTGGGGTTPPTGNTEYATVEEVHKIYSQASPTIGGIIYDSGTTGLCTIQPSVNMAGLARNTLIELGSEFVRIISVTNGVNGITSFRASTSGTHTAGEAISIPTNGNFFIYLTGTHAAGEFLWCSVFQFQVNPGSKGGQGLVYANAATGSPWSLAIAGGRPLTPDDYLHISIWTDHPEYISQAQLIIDVDPGTTVSHQATDGTYNAYIKTLRGSDFQQYVSNLQTADAERAASIQLELQNASTLPLASNLTRPGALGTGQTSTPSDIATDQPTAPPLPLLGSTTSQMTTGATQWTEFKFRLADFTRIGSVQISDWSQVHAILLSFVTTNNVFVSMAGLWTGGGYGPDSGNNLAPLIYRYRYRSSTIGSLSLPGPATRSGITSARQGVLLSAVSSGDAQVDKIDFERLGGSNLEWHYVGTCDNGVASLLDDKLSAGIKINAALETDTFQPFTLSAAPITVTATVAGSAVSVTSGLVNSSMAIGTEIIINGILTTLYAVPTSSTLFHVADSMGFGTEVKVEIQEPIITGQPMPVMWGPFQETIFAVGNSLDAGSFYFTKPGDPDSSADTNRVTVSSPSEALLNGTIYDTRNYIWSDRRLFQITPGGPNGFVYNPIASGKGLASRWSFTVGPKVWFVSQDGIYEFTGGEPVLISGDIKPIFPQGDDLGIIVRGLAPINMAGPLRLTYINRYLIFDYQDITSAHQTLVYDTSSGSWFYDQYAVPFLFHHTERSVVAGEEVFELVAGGGNGRLYSIGGATDNGVPISWEIDTVAFNAGDLRAKKLFGDNIFDLNSFSATVTATPWINDYAAPLAPFSVSTAIRQITNPFDLPIDTFAINLGFKFTGTGPIEFYSWEPAFLIRPEDTFVRADDWNDGGYGGSKYVRGFLLEADTGGVTRTIILEGDYNNLQTFSMTHSGQTVIAYALQPGQFSTLLRFVPQDPDFWRVFRVSYLFDEVPENAAIAQSWTNDGYEGAKYVRGVNIEALGTASVAVEYDGGIVASTLSLNHVGSMLFELPYSFSVPFFAHDLRLNPATAIRLGQTKWIYDPVPEDTPLIQPYTNDGYQGSKFVQGAVIEALGDSLVTVEYDGGTVGATLTLSHGGNFLESKPYAFNPPFIAHEFRLNPTSHIRLGRVKWVWEPTPESVYYWETQETTHDLPGYQFIKDLYISHVSTADIQLGIYVDGTLFGVTIPNSGGHYQKTYLVFPIMTSGRPLKGKVFKYILTSSAPFQLFQRDCEVRVHSWYGGSYVSKNPFGDVSRINGARI